MTTAITPANEASAPDSIRAFTPTAYYAPRCVLCDTSCRFRPTVKLPQPVKAPSTGRERHCAHAECLDRAWREGSELALPSPDEVRREQARYYATRR